MPSKQQNVYKAIDTQQWYWNKHAVNIIYIYMTSRLKILDICNGDQFHSTLRLGVEWVLK